MQTRYIGRNQQDLQKPTSNLEELHEVVKLTVDISTDSDWAGNGLASKKIIRFLFSSVVDLHLHIALLRQDFFSLLAENFHLVIGGWR